MAAAAVMKRAELPSANDPKENEKGRTAKKIDEIAKEIDEMGIVNDDEADLRDREQGILELGEKLKNTGRASELGQLIKGTRPFLSLISKAKAAKLVRALVEMFLDMDAATGYEVELCQECIQWARDEKRIFLRQNLEARLMSLYFDLGHYSDALSLGSELLKELKKLDDKNLLVEVLLCESKTYHGLGNLSKARAALTSARTTANGVYTPPKMQAALDMQAGVLHAADERDFKTAYSYFYEAFEGFDSVNSPRALTALKYMLLCKVMLRLHEDVPAIISGKLALRYAGKEVEALKRITTASRNRSLAEFQEALNANKKELEDDPIIKSHLGALYDQMLEQNLIRIIEPYSKVEVEHVAECIALDRDAVEKKLSQMILDKKFAGILDQGNGVLEVFTETEKDDSYEIALNIVGGMSKVVDTLFMKAKKLT